MVTTESISLKTRNLFDFSASFFETLWIVIVCDFDLDLDQWTKIIYIKSSLQSS